MEKQVRQATFGICAAVIGAGFATGRETVTFFSRFGAWSWLGVGLAGLMAALMTYHVMGKSACCTARNVEGLCGSASWRRVLRWAFLLLMTVTGAVMLAGAGNVVALALPVRGARWLGMAVTLLLALALCCRKLRMLSVLGTVLTVCLLAVMALGLLSARVDAAEIDLPAPTWLRIGEAALGGLLWSGFNLTFASPLLCEMAADMRLRVRCRLAVNVGLALTLLLALSNALLLRHPLLQNDEMPLIRLLSGYGTAGYALGCAAMYLAMLTTLIAALSGFAQQLKLRRISPLLPAGAAIGITSVAGFGTLVEKAYPVLGGLCLLLLLPTLFGKRKKSS